MTSSKMQTLTATPRSDKGAVGSHRANSERSYRGWRCGASRVGFSCHLQHGVRRRFGEARQPRSGRRVRSPPWRAGFPVNRSDLRIGSVGGACYRSRELGRCV